MKRLLVLLIVLYSCSCSASIREEHYQIINERVKVNFDLKKSMLFCSDELKITKNNSKVIAFEVPADAKVISILVNNEKADYTFRNSVVSILLDKEKEEINIFISYSIKFKGEINLKNMNFEDPSSNLISHVSPDGVFIGGDVLWYPRFYTKPANKEITFVSEDFEFITEGKRIGYEKNSNSIKSTWLIDHNVRNVPILGGPYIIKEKKSGNLKLFMYSFKENLSMADRYLDAVEKYIKLYSDLIGPYPYEKFAVVETYLPVGISYQTFTIISKDLIKLPFIIETSLPHEVLHSWFGNGVFVDYKSGNWSEGLVTYLADYLMKEKKSKKEAIDYLRKLTVDYSTIIKENEDFPLINFYGRYDLATRVVGYGKSAMFFHYLRFIMGDENFYGSLKDFYNKNLFKTASWNDLKDIFSKKKGDEIRTIFEEWLDRKGSPDMNLTKVMKKVDEGMWILSFSIEQVGQEYLLKLPVSIYGKDGSLILSEIITLKGKVSNFNFKVSKEPVELRINENYDVLRRLKDEEIPATVNSIKSARNILFVTNSANFSKEFIDRFVKTMGIKRYKISQSIDENFDVIVHLGINKKLNEKDITIDKTFFALKGEKFSDENDAIFLVLRKKNKIFGYLQSFSQEGAMKVAHRITHYGPFSYLVFRDGINLEKGLIEPEKNSLVFKF